MEPSNQIPPKDTTGKQYQPPQIVVELDLETRAGSPLGLPGEPLISGK